MSSPSPLFEEAFSRLIKYLQDAVKQKDIISIPYHIEKPFRAALHVPDTKQLRLLSRIFEGKQHHLLQLSPKSFCGIVFIVSYLPYSIVQEKLLYAFIDALKIYRDDKAAIAALKNYGITKVTRTQLQDDLRTTAERLIHTLLRRLVSGGITRTLRWTIAQFLLALAQCGDDVRARFISYGECKHFSTLLQDLDDYVGRILVADLMRELIHHGTDANVFWPDGVADQKIMSFPVAQTSSMAWIGNLQEYFADLDAGIAFGAGRQSMFLVRELSRRSASTETTTHHVVAVISNEIAIISSEVSASLSVSLFPIFKESEMKVNRETAEEDAVSATYPADNGLEICKGRKSAITAITMSFESSDEAQIVETTILEGQKLALKDADTMNAQQTLSEEDQSEPKRSIAILNLWSPTDSPAIRTEQKPQNASNEGSETQEMSPLRHRSQKLSQLDRLGQQNSDNGKAEASDNVSETSYPEGVPDQARLSVRLRSSQEANHNQNQLKDFHARVDDAVARQKSLPSARAVAHARSLAKEGRTTKTPHLPRPSVDIIAKSQSPANTSSSKLKKKPPAKDDIGQSISQTKVLVRTVATEPDLSPNTASASRKLKTTSATKIVVPPRPSTSATRLNQTLKGPMARLAGSQPQSKLPSSKAESQTKTGSKRKTAPSKKDTSDENVDWDEGLQDESQYDLPGDPIDDERPTKKAKKAAKQTVQKTASKPPATQAKEAGTFKKPAPKARKTKEDTSAAEIPKPTVASTRTRRAAANPTTYEEDSASDPVEAGSQRSPANHVSIVLKPAHPNSDSKAKSATGAKAQKDSKKTQTLHSDDHTTNNAHASVIERDSPQQHDGLHIEADVSRQNSPVTAPEALHSAVAAADEVDDDAQDSYPMDKASRDAAAAKTDTSFDKQLQTQLKATKASKMANQENATPLTKIPKTPLGNAKQFIANVNAAKSTSPKKRSAQSASRPQTKVRPSEKPKQVPSTRADITTEPPAVAEATIQSLKKQELRGGGIQEQELLQPLQDEADQMDIAEEVAILGTSGLSSVARETTSNDVDTSKPVVNEAPSLPTQAAFSAKLVPKRDAGDDSIADPERSPRPSPKSDAASLMADHHIEQAVTHSKASNGNEVAQATRQPVSLIRKVGQITAAATPERAAKGTADPKMSTSNRASNAAKPPRLITVATTKKPSDSRISDAVSLPPHTPGRSILAMEDSLTSDEALKKTSIIKFGKDGPRNQGVRKPGNASDASEVQSALPRTVKHTKAKAQHNEVREITTPSRDPDSSVSRPISISDDGHVDPDDIGIDIQPDTEAGAEMQPVIENEVLELREQFTKAEPKTHAASPRANTLPNHDVEDASDESLHSKDRDDYSAGGSSSAETEDMDESDYQEPTDSIDDSQELEDTESVVPKSRSHVPAPPSTPRSENVARLQRAVPKASVTEPANIQRQSIGLRDIVGGIHKGAAEDIATKPFRWNQHPSATTSAVNVTAIVGEESTRLKNSHHAIRAAQDKTSMPPPPIKRIGAEQMTTPGTHMKDASMKAGVIFQAFEARGPNPVAETRPAPLLPEIAEPNELLPNLKPRRRSRASTVRISKEVVEHDDAAELYSGTPISFHSKLVEAVKDTDTVSGRKTGSHFSDTTGTTLLNRSSLSGFAQRQPMRLEFERGMTETTDDSMSQAWGGELAWMNVRPSYRKFVQYVAQITDDVLFRLGVEEDAIEAKMADFQRGGGVAHVDLANSWEHGMAYEAHVLEERLNDAAESVDGMATVIAESDKFSKQKENLRRHADVRVGIAQRRDEILGIINELVGSVKD